MLCKLFYFGLLLLLVVSCRTQQVSEQERPCRPVSSEEFLNQPFYAQLLIDSVRQAYGTRFRLTRFLRDMGNTDQIKDTIYRFHNQHTSLVFYKNSGGEESFLTSKIADRSLQLRPCLRVGMPRIRVEELITDFPSDFRDTVTLQNEKRQAVFIFKESQLKTVFVNNFFK